MPSYRLGNLTTVNGLPAFWARLWPGKWAREGAELRCQAPTSVARAAGLFTGVREAGAAGTRSRPTWARVAELEGIIGRDLAALREAAAMLTARAKPNPPPRARTHRGLLGN